MLDDYFRQYGLIAIFAGVALFVPISMMMLSWLASKVRIRPNKPELVKSEVYECGMATIGGKWGQFNFRYYVYALLIRRVRRSSHIHLSMGRKDEQTGLLRND